MDRKYVRIVGIGAAMGLMIGTVIGAATDNVGVWLVVGFIFGAAIGATIGRILATYSNGD
ncbi:MAG: hypothetical protein IH865_04190 [Chloroflexi bacterium]|nr:hypothetical protein [Chloroflexota bacterium]